jgi:hypothetical protein
MDVHEAFCWPQEVAKDTKKELIREQLPFLRPSSFFLLLRILRLFAAINPSAQ